MRWIAPLVLLCLCSLCCSNIHAEHQSIPIRPVSTYSIIAIDPVTGQIGAAVQSHWFKVADVIWVEPEIGAVATQSLVDFSYGPLGLEMLKNGKTAQQALQGLLASDPQSAVRQVAILDADGFIAAHTGDKCIPHAGHFVGETYSVQANLMEKATVPRAMSRAFENATGDLAERLMIALEAAEAEGGDIRGRQSAAIVVVGPDATGRRWQERIVDLRVDDSPQPLKELRRLLDISRAYDHMNRGDELIATGEFDLASLEYEKASALAPGNAEILFWYAVTLVTAGEVDRALPIFKRVFAMGDNWRQLIPRLVTAELLPDDEELIERITMQ